MNAKETEALQDLFQLFQNHNYNKQDKVVNFKKPDELTELVDFELRENGSDYQELLSFFDKYLNYSVNTSHPQFVNQLWSGQNFPAVLSEMLVAFTNASAYTYEVAPMATLIETKLINDFCNYVGFENGDGTFATGGSNANLLSMIVARNQKLPKYKEEGASAYGKLVLFVSDQAHYSFEKAANTMGIGTQSIVRIKSDQNGKMIASSLEDEIRLSIQRNEVPFYVAATLGTTELGAFDNINDIYKITRKYNLWLHGDGAWGGAVLLSEKHKVLIQGSNLCDSFAWDAHKLMGIPLIASLALFKDKSHLIDAVSTQNSTYIFHEHDFESYDLGMKSLQCGRRIDSLKLWSAMKFYGKSGYENRIDKCFEIATYLIEQIKLDETLELLHEPEFLNINFRYQAANCNLNDLNLKIREYLHFSGKALVNYCWIHHNDEKILSIRYVASNPNLTFADIDSFLLNFKFAASEILNKYE